MFHPVIILPSCFLQEREAGLCLLEEDMQTDLCLRAILT